METLPALSQDLYNELMRRAQQNKELMKRLEIGEKAWRITINYEKALKAMKPTHRPKTTYSNRSE